MLLKRLAVSQLNAVVGPDLVRTHFGSPDGWRSGFIRVESEHNAVESHFA